MAFISTHRSPQSPNPLLSVPISPPIPLAPQIPVNFSRSPSPNPSSPHHQIPSESPRPKHKPTTSCGDLISETARVYASSTESLDPPNFTVIIPQPIYATESDPTIGDLGVMIHPLKEFGYVSLDLLRTNLAIKTAEMGSTDSLKTTMESYFKEPTTPLYENMILQQTKRSRELLLDLLWRVIDLVSLFERYVAYYVNVFHPPIIFHEITPNDSINTLHQIVNHLVDYVNEIVVHRGRSIYIPHKIASVSDLPQELNMTCLDFLKMIQSKDTNFFSWLKRKQPHLERLTLENQVGEYSIILENHHDLLINKLWDIFNTLKNIISSIQTGSTSPK